MTRFCSLKALIRPWLKQADWSPLYALPPEITANPTLSLLSLVNPLFACLTEGDTTAERAAVVLGGVLSQIYAESPESAKNIVRRFMWHMNEESGNIGWGIPEAFGETLAQCRPLADNFYRVLFSYIRDLPGDSTYCDYAPLRRSCYKAVGRVAKARPDLASDALPLLEAGRADPDEMCREIATKLFAELSC